MTRFVLVHIKLTGKFLNRVLLFGTILLLESVELLLQNVVFTCDLFFTRKNLRYLVVGFANT